MCAHDDQVGPAALRRIQDGAVHHRLVAQQQALARYTGGPRHRLGLRQPVLGGLQAGHRLQIVMGPVAAGHDAGREVFERGHHRDPGAQAPGQLDAALHRALGRLGTIGGKQDVLEHGNLLDVSVTASL